MARRAERRAVVGALSAAVLLSGAVASWGGSTPNTETQASTPWTTASTPTTTERTTPTKKSHVGPT